MPVPTVRALTRLRTTLARWRSAGETMALVPTMGALHAGHVSLVRLARRRAQRVVVSIFVNPAQFAPNEDFARYPRDEAGDVALLSEAGCDLVWAPDVAQMYPQGFATRVVPAGAAEGLESEFRPHFFSGVATVCCKLITQTGADIAVFGEKDYQQLCVVRQMARDLDLPVRIVGAPTVREADGLAMSSRNAYLSAGERAIAPAIHREIVAVSKALAQRGDPDALCRQARANLLAAGFAKIDYVSVRDAATLEPAARGHDGPKRVLAAAWLGRTRLIDNVAAGGRGR